MKVRKYNETNKQQWDSFVKEAKKTHFMFLRDYMEYHSSKFEDHSLVFFDDKDQLICLLPANICDNELISHQGLSFGGMILNSNATCELVLDVFKLLKEYMSENEIERCIYKRIPKIYENMPSDEDLYALFINNASLLRRDCSVSIDLKNKIPYQKRRNRSIKKALKYGVEVIEVQDFSRYWELLDEVLKKQHGTLPVHSLEEISYLKANFEKNIRCFVAMKDSKVIAGTVIYISGRVAHCQYLASNDFGRETGALDLVLDKIINNEFSDHDYFDFGISNEENGRHLNKGLIAQKEGFGARAIVHDFYEIAK